MKFDYHAPKMNTDINMPMYERIEAPVVDPEKFGSCPRCWRGNESPSKIIFRVSREYWRMVCEQGHHWTAKTKTEKEL